MVLRKREIRVEAWWRDGFVGRKSKTFCRRKTNKIKGKFRVMPKVKHLARVQLRCYRKTRNE